MINVGTAVGYLELDTSRYSSALRTAGQQLSVFSDENSTSIQRLQGLGGAMETVGMSLMKGVTVPLVTVGATALKFSTDFNSAMANIGTLIPGQTARLGELKSEIQDLSIEVGKGTTDIADGTYQVISAFGDSAETMQKVAINAKAATAGVSTTTDAINLTSAVTKGYGDTSAAAIESVADLAFQTVKLGQTTFPELAASIGNVVPLSAELGVKQQELFNIFAASTGVTGNAAEVSTQYRGVLQALMAPTGEMANLFGKLGVANGKAMIQQYGLKGSMDLIVGAANDSGTPLQKYIGSIEGQTIALALTGAQSDVYIEKLEAMQNSTGVMEEAFREQTEGINATGFAFKQAMISMQVAAQKMGDVLAPILMRISELIINLAGWFNGLDEETRKTIGTIGVIATVVGPVLFIFGKLITIILSLADIFTKVKAAISGAGGVMALLTNPVGIAIGVLTLLTAAVIYLWKTNEEFRENLRIIWSQIQEIFQITIDGIRGLIELFVELAIALWQRYGDTITFITDTVWNIISGIIEGATMVIKGILDVFIGLVTGDWNRFTDGLKSIWDGMWKAIEAVVRGAWDLIKGAFKLLYDSILGWFTGLVKDAFNWGRNMIRGFTDGIKSMASNVTAAVRGVMNGVKGFLGFNSPTEQGPGQYIEIWGANMIEGFLDGVRSAIPDLEATMVKIIPNIPKMLPDGIMGSNYYGGGNSSFYIDYDRLANAISRNNTKGNISYNIENHFTPAESTPAQHVKRQERMLRKFALDW